MNGYDVKSFVMFYLISTNWLKAHHFAMKIRYLWNLEGIYHFKYYIDDMMFVILRGDFFWLF